MQSGGNSYLPNGWLTELDRGELGGAEERREETGTREHSLLCAGYQWRELERGIGKLEACHRTPVSPSCLLGIPLPVLFLVAKVCSHCAPLAFPSPWIKVQQRPPQPSWALCAFCMTTRVSILRQSVISLVKISFTTANAFLCIPGFSLLIFCCGFHIASLSGLGVRTVLGAQNELGTIPFASFPFPASHLSSKRNRNSTHSIECNEDYTG